MMCSYCGCQLPWGETLYRIATARLHPECEDETVATFCAWTCLVNWVFVQEGK